MPMPFVQENTASRTRLEALVGSLSADDMSCSNASGWTVSALLAHLAYWDRRVLVLLRRWKQAEVDYSPVDPDAVNDAIKPLCLKLEPAAAKELCLSSAWEVDSELESISAVLVEQIEASQNHFRFNRGLHRSNHLNEIEAILKERR